MPHSCFPSDSTRDGPPVNLGIEIGIEIGTGTGIDSDMDGCA